MRKMLYSELYSPSLFSIPQSRITKNAGKLRAKKTILMVDDDALCFVLVFSSKLLFSVAHIFWDLCFLIFLSTSLGMLFINPDIENPLKMIISPGRVLLMILGLFGATQNRRGYDHSGCKNDGTPDKGPLGVMIKLHKTHFSLGVTHSDEQPEKTKQMRVFAGTIAPHVFDRICRSFH